MGGRVQSESERIEERLAITTAVADSLGVPVQTLIDTVMELAKGRLSVAPFVHGTWSRYKSGCRCDPCRDYFRERGMRVSDDTPHGRWRYTTGCRCTVCVDAQTMHRRITAKRVQARTQDKARRRGYQWTGPELELAGRSDLTTEQVAVMLGRTFSGVKHMRARLKSDPRYQHSAGVSMGDQDRDSG